MDRWAARHVEVQSGITGSGSSESQRLAVLLLCSAEISRTDGYCCEMGTLAECSERVTVILVFTGIGRPVQ